MTCSARRTKYPGPCWDAARFYVTPIGRAGDGQYACTQHLAKVCRTVASGAETVHVVVLANLPERK